jgi:hypothetical protein
MGVHLRKKPEAERLPAPRTPFRDFLAASVLFALATLVLSYPLALHPASLSRLDNGDARLNAWAISWVAHQVLHEPFHLFDGNTFHPLPNSLAYSEHLALLGVLAVPLLSFTDDLVLTTNLLLLFSMFVSALGMYWLARTLTSSHLASLLAGLFFSFALFRFNRLPHIQMQLYAFLPLCLASWHRFLDTRKVRDLALVSLFFVLQVLSGTYLGAIVAVALAIAILFLAPFARLSSRDLLRVGLALVLAAAFIYPFASPYLWVNRELGIEWDLPGVGSLAATPWSYLASSSHLYRALGEHLLRDKPVTDYLFPGLTLVVLAPIGAVVLARERGRRAILACYLAILAAGVLLSLGPKTAVYSFLYEHVVFFRGLRALTRFALLPQLSLSVLAAFGLAWLLESRRGLSHPNRVALGIGLFFAAESTALPYRLEEFRDDPPEVYRWLEGAKPGPMVELPFKVIDTQYMFWARHHGFRPMVNGDSGFVPMSHQWVKNALLRFPSPDSIALLRTLKVRYVVLHLGAFREGALLRTLKGLEAHRDSLVPVRDFGRDLVFELVPPAPALPRAGGPVELDVSGNDPRLFDSDFASLVLASGPEHLVDVEIPEGASLSTLRFHYGPAPRVPVERVEVLVEGPDGFEPRWSTPPDWPAVTALVEGLLATPKDGTQSIDIEPAIEGRMRIRMRGLDGEPPEIAEIVALGSRASPAAAQTAVREEKYFFR